MPFRQPNATLRPNTHDQLRPWVCWSSIVLVIFAVEYGLMFLLPWIIGNTKSVMIVAVADSVSLSFFIAPILWWLLVRPLQRAGKLRDYYLSDLFTTMEDERRRISRELHDGVGQLLTMLTSGLRTIESLDSREEIHRRLKDLQELAQRAIRDTKQLTTDLRPSLLDDLGLCYAMEKVIAEIQIHHPIKIDCDVHDKCRERLPETVETALFRVFQEALTNVVNHAKATRCSVKLSRNDCLVTMSIQDDGCGMDTTRLKNVERNNGHWGLIGMAERVSLLDGNFFLDSTLGQGTRIDIHIPLVDSK